MLFSAAAVSDFYIPYNDMAEHKIQSSEGDPHIALTNTPKMLYLVTREWASDAYNVSFKLETDIDILDNTLYFHVLNELEKNDLLFNRSFNNHD